MEKLTSYTYVGFFYGPAIARMVVFFLRNCVPTVSYKKVADTNIQMSFPVQNTVFMNDFNIARFKFSFTRHVYDIIGMVSFHDVVSSFKGEGTKKLLSRSQGRIRHLIFGPLNGQNKKNCTLRNASGIVLFRKVQRQDAFIS